MRTIDLDGPPDPQAPPGNALEACDQALIDILTALPRNPDTWAASIETCDDLLDLRVRIVATYIPEPEPESEPPTPTKPATRKTTTNTSSKENQS